MYIHLSYQEWKQYKGEGKLVAWPYSTNDKFVFIIKE